MINTTEKLLICYPQRKLQLMSFIFDFHNSLLKWSKYVSACRPVYWLDLITPMSLTGFCLYFDQAPHWLILTRLPTDLFWPGSPLTWGKVDIVLGVTWVRGDSDFCWQIIFDTQLNMTMQYNCQKWFLCDIFDETLYVLHFGPIERENWSGGFQSNSSVAIVKTTLSLFTFCLWQHAALFEKVFLFSGSGGWSRADEHLDVGRDVHCTTQYILTWSSAWPFSHHQSIPRDASGNPSLGIHQEIYPKGCFRKSIPKDVSGNPSLRMYQEIYPKGCIRKCIPRDVSGNPFLGMYQEIHP